MPSQDPLASWRAGRSCPDAAATEAAGAELARLLPRGTALLLEGPLGAGKTTLVRGLARGLGLTGDLTSPSYSLVNLHDLPGGGRLVHVDAYRLDDARQAEGLLLDEIAGPGDIMVIEWAERLGPRAPQPSVRVRIEETPEGGRWLRVLDREI
jgi:tRNA threonylcarbamoyladenosine biosynthesis protein TsaE